LRSEVVRKTIAGDNPERLSRKLRAALNLADVVVPSGELGPTEDDLTREVLSAILRRSVARNEEILKDLEAKLQRFGRVAPPKLARRIGISSHSRKRRPGYTLPEAGQGRVRQAAVAERL
jgi:molybdopterin-biosynthesis enzyme MoeA-like protein